MNRLAQLSPKRVFEIFEEICAIPHGSGNTLALGKWCVRFAQNLGLDSRTDDAGNVVVYKPGTKGREEEPPLILQAHLDMVCAKIPECAIDFETQGITPVTDGQTVWAEGTTLGADNGIGLSMILAVLEDQDLSHPPIEGVFTADEETGLIGAGALDGSWLTGRRMINLDSEDEGIFTCGCAGGSRTTVRLPLTRVPNTMPGYRVVFQGFTGGHSGIEIHKNRGNANCAMGAFLKKLYETYPCAIASLSGGALENAIAKEAACVVGFGGTADQLSRLAKEECKGLVTGEDPDVVCSVEPVATPEWVWDAPSTQRVLGYVTTAPNGVQAMMEHLPGVVETSLNLGVASCDQEEMVFIYALRSGVESKRDALHRQVEAVARSFGGTAVSGFEYPAWEYIANSPLRTRMEQVFFDVYGKAPVTEVIHAGLECGMFSQKCPGMDGVSMGPDMRDVHTPDERVFVASVERVYEYLCRLLASL